MTTATTFDWGLLIATSEYDALVAIRDAVREGNLTEAETGLQEFIETVARHQFNSVRSHLKQLMAHVLKWKIQPLHRSGSWSSTIINARDEIFELQLAVPSITDDDLRDMWDGVFQKAKRLAAAETGIKVTVTDLTWQEVFETDYLLCDED